MQLPTERPDSKPLPPGSTVGAGGPTDEIAAIGVLAGLLERMERGGRPVQAGPYRDLVERMSGLLRRADGNPLLARLLASAPATAELYENLRYEWAGLCLQPLDRSMVTERQAREAIEKARRR